MVKYDLEIEDMGLVKDDKYLAKAMRKAIHDQFPFLKVKIRRRA